MWVIVGVTLAGLASLAAVAAGALWYLGIVIHNALPGADHCLP